jgi:DNA-binding PadR family transcriptional regulator
MARHRRPANPLALAVLTLLDERAMHPYEMSSTLRQRSKEQSIKLNYGSLYAVVESLQRSGLVEVQDTVREGRRPERTVYAITEAGRGVMVDWLSDLLETPSKEFPAFEAALSLMMALPPDDVVELLDRRAQALAMRLSADRAMLSSVSSLPRVFMIEGEFAVAMREAELAFVRGLLDDLRAETLGGLPMWRRLDELRSQGMPSADIERTLTEEFGALTFEPGPGP